MIASMIPLEDLNKLNETKNTDIHEYMVISVTEDNEVTVEPLPFFSKADENPTKCDPFFVDFNQSTSESVFNLLINQQCHELNKVVILCTKNLQNKKDHNLTNFFAESCTKITNFSLSLTKEIIKSKYWSKMSLQSIIELDSSISAFFGVFNIHTIFLFNDVNTFKYNTVLSIVSLQKLVKSIIEYIQLLFFEETLFTFSSVQLADSFTEAVPSPSSDLIIKFDSLQIRDSEIIDFLRSLAIIKDTFVKIELKPISSARGLDDKSFYITEYIVHFETNLQTLGIINYSNTTKDSLENSLKGTQKQSIWASSKFKTIVSMTEFLKLVEIQGKQFWINIRDVIKEKTKQYMLTYVKFNDKAYGVPNQFYPKSFAQTLSTDAYKSYLCYEKFSKETTVYNPKKDSCPYNTGSQRYQISLDGPKESLQITYFDISSALYNNNKLVGFEIDEQVKNFNTNKGSYIGDFAPLEFFHHKSFNSSTFLMGNFTKVFSVEDTNDLMSLQFHKDLSAALVKKSPIFILGYGSSGSGKTSTLINLNIGDGISGVVIQLLDKLPEANTIKLTVNEFFYDNKASIFTKEYDFTKNGNQYSTDISLAYNNSFREYKSINDELFKKQQKVVDIAKKKRTLQDIILFHIESDRRIKWTPNNPESSRSHVLFDISMNDQHIFVGDFAGLENEFDEENYNTVSKFINAKRKGPDGNDLEKLFYIDEDENAKDLSNIDDLFAGFFRDAPDGSSIYLLEPKLSTMTVSEITNYLNDINAKNLNENILKSYLEKKRNESNIKLINDIHKLPSITGETMIKVGNQIERTHPYVYTCKTSSIVNITAAYSTTDSKNQVSIYFVNTTQNLNPTTDEKNKMKFKDISKLNSPDNSEIFNLNIGETQNIKLKNVSFSIIRNQGINSKASSIAISQKQDISSNFPINVYYKFNLGNNKDWQLFFRSDQTENSDIIAINTVEKFLNDNTQIQCTEDMKLSYFIENLKKTYTIFTENIDPMKNPEDELNCKYYLENIVRLSETIQNLLNILKIGQQICLRRKKEGEYINGSVRRLRNQLLDIIHVKNSDSSILIPNAIDDCFYCTNDNSCLSRQSKTNESVQVDAVSVIDEKKYSEDLSYNILSTLFKAINNITIEDFCKTIVPCIVCMFNTARSDDPPKIPYLNINSIKKCFYDFQESQKPYLIHLPDAKYPVGQDQDAQDQDAQNNKHLIAFYKFTETMSTLIEQLHTLITYYNENYDMSVLSNITNKNVLFVNPVNFQKLFNNFDNMIKCIDTWNEASSIGTLEFMDSFCKFNRNRYMCDKLAATSATVYSPMYKPFENIIPPAGGSRRKLVRKNQTRKK